MNIVLLLFKSISFISFCQYFASANFHTRCTPSQTRNRYLYPHNTTKMSQAITSNVVGPLKQDAQLPDWWKSEAIAIPFFDHQQLTVTYITAESDNDATFMTDADQALTQFLQLTSDVRHSISPLVTKNCMDFLEAVEYDEHDEPLVRIGAEHSIWDFVAPIEIFLSRRYRRDEDIYVQIDCECNWDEEHGLQLVFRQGKKLTRISGIDGHLTAADAYDTTDEEDELLSEF